VPGDGKQQIGKAVELLQWDGIYSGGTGQAVGEQPGTAAYCPHEANYRGFSGK